MDYDQIITEILNYSQRQFEIKNDREYIIQYSKLLAYFNRKYPHVDRKDIVEMLKEMDVRGWLLRYTNQEIEFDPATFS